MPYPRTQQANLPAYLHTIPLMLSVKQESCEYQLFSKSFDPTRSRIKLRSANHQVNALTTKEFQPWCGCMFLLLYVGLCTFAKGLSKKESTVRGERLFSVNIFRTRGKGSLDADVRTIWCKNIGFFQNLWCVRSNKGELGQSGHFWTREMVGSIFSRFCADVLYGRPLMILILPID